VSPYSVEPLVFSPFTPPNFHLDLLGHFELPVSPDSAEPLVIYLSCVPVLILLLSFSFAFEFLAFELFGVFILRRMRLSRFDLDGLLLCTKISYVVEGFFGCNSFVASRMVVTRAGVSTSTNQYLPSPSEGPQVAENPRVQDPDDLTNPVTREVSDYAPPVPSESVCGPFMDPMHNEGGQAQSKLSSMTPMLFIIAEMQRELGELRRSKERGHVSDSEDSDDRSVSVPLFETDTVLSATELSARTYDGLIPTVCHDPRFRRILDYRYYRLYRRSDRYDSHIASKVSRWARQMEASFKLRFDGSDPLAVLKFMNAFVEAANTNGIRYSAALHVLRSFLDSPAREEFTASRATAFPMAVNWLTSSSHLLVHWQPNIRPYHL
jgi:hypothetical protein